MGDILQLILLIIATVLIIVGTAITWDTYRKNDTFTQRAFQQLYQYNAISFPFALLTAWVHWIFGQRDTLGRIVWRFFFYGMFFYIGVQSVSYRVQYVDDLRYSDASKVTITNGYAAIDSTQARKLLGGAVLDYLGLFVLLAVIHGKFNFRANFATITMVVSIVFNIIGIVVLWNNKQAYHSQNNPEARAYIFDQITIPQTFLLLILAGAVWHEHSDGANAAMVFFACYGVWYLRAGFGLKAAIVENGDVNSSSADNAWAGALFCWFSAWTAFISARFAVVNHAGDVDGASVVKVTPLQQQAAPHHAPENSHV